MHRLRLLAMWLMHLACICMLLQPPSVLFAGVAFANSGIQETVAFAMPAPAWSGLPDTVFEPGGAAGWAGVAVPASSSPLGPPQQQAAPSGTQETRPATMRDKERLFDRLPEAQAIATLVRDKVQFVDAVYDLKEMVADRRPFDPARKASIEQRMALREAALILKGRAEAQEHPTLAALGCEPDTCQLAQYAVPMTGSVARIAAQAIFTIFLAHGPRVNGWAIGLLGIVAGLIVLAAARNCGGVVALIGGQCSGATSRPGNGMQPPGDCGQNQHEGLQRRVEDLCNRSGRMGCDRRNMTRVEIATNKDRILRCISARKEIMDLCFKGGDDVHHEQLRQRYSNLENCNRAIPID